MYTEAHKAPDAKRLPENLLDALRGFEADETLTRGARRRTSRRLRLKLKRDDWGKYTRHLTDWERDTTLDC